MDATGYFFQMEAARQFTHIDTSGERPVVSGTDIKVSQIASEHEHLGMTPDEIVDAHPHLTLADVHAALTHYYDNLEAVRSEWQEAQSLISSLESRYPSRIGVRRT